MCCELRIEDSRLSIISPAHQQQGWVFAMAKSIFARTVEKNWQKLAIFSHCLLYLFLFKIWYNYIKPGIGQVQALADILCSTL